MDQQDRIFEIYNKSEGLLRGCLNRWNPRSARSKFFLLKHVQRCTPCREWFGSVPELESNSYSNDSAEFDCVYDGPSFSRRNTSDVSVPQSITEEVRLIEEIQIQNTLPSELGMVCAHLYASINFHEGWRLLFFHLFQDMTYNQVESIRAVHQYNCLTLPAMLNILRSNVESMNVNLPPTKKFHANYRINDMDGVGSTPISWLSYLWDIGQEYFQPIPIIHIINGSAVMNSFNSGMYFMNCGHSQMLPKYLTHASTEFFLGDAVATGSCYASLQDVLSDVQISEIICGTIEKFFLLKRQTDYGEAELYYVVLNTRHISLVANLNLQNRNTSNRYFKHSWWLKEKMKLPYFPYVFPMELEYFHDDGKLQSNVGIMEIFVTTPQFKEEFGTKPQSICFCLSHRSDGTKQGTIQIARFFLEDLKKLQNGFVVFNKHAGQFSVLIPYHAGVVVDGGMIAAASNTTGPKGKRNCPLCCFDNTNPEGIPIPQFKCDMPGFKNILQIYDEHCLNPTPGFIASIKALHGVDIGVPKSIYIENIDSHLIGGDTLHLLELGVLGKHIVAYLHSKTFGPKGCKVLRAYVKSTNSSGASRYITTFSGTGNGCSHLYGYHFHDLTRTLISIVIFLNYIQTDYISIRQNWDLFYQKFGEGGYLDNFYDRNNYPKWCEFVLILKMWLICSTFLYKMVKSNHLWYRLFYALDMTCKSKPKIHAFGHFYDRVKMRGKSQNAEHFEQKNKMLKQEYMNTNNRSIEVTVGNKYHWRDLMSRVIAGNNVFVSSKGKYSKLSMDSGERNRLYHHIAPKIAKAEEKSRDVSSQEFKLANATLENLLRLIREAYYLLGSEFDVSRLNNEIFQKYPQILIKSFRKFKSVTSSSEGDIIFMECNKTYSMVHGFLEFCCPNNYIQLYAVVTNLKLTQDKGIIEKIEAALEKSKYILQGIKDRDTNIFSLRITDLLQEMVPFHCFALEHIVNFLPLEHDTKVQQVNFQHYCTTDSCDFTKDPDTKNDQFVHKYKENRNWIFNDCFVGKDNFVAPEIKHIDFDANLDLCFNLNPE